MKKPKLQSDLKRIEISNCEGKTIKTTHYTMRESLIIVFTDQTFAIIDADSDPYEDCPTIYDSSRPLTDFYTSALIDVGILTKEQVEAYNCALTTYKEETVRKIEINQLNRLKAKYPNN